MRENETLKRAAKEEEQVWINTELEVTEEALSKLNIGMADIEDAENGWNALLRLL